MYYYCVVTNMESGKTATVTSKVAKITVVTVLDVTVSGVSVADRAYDGTAITPAGTPKAAKADNTDVTAGIDSWTYKYKGRDGTSYAESATAPKNAGKYTLAVSAVDTLYTGKQTVDFEILKKEVTVSADTYKLSKTYDGKTDAGTASGSLKLEGVLSADSGVTVSVGTLPAYSAAKAGTYTLSLPISLSGDTDGNYKLKTATVAVPAEILKKEIAVEAGTYKVSKTYDGKTDAGTASGSLKLEGILSADSGVTVSVGTLPAYSAAKAGAYTLSLPISLSGDTDGNYELKTATVAVPAVIEQKEVTVSAGTYKLSKAYDKTTDAGTASGSLKTEGVLSADSGVTVSVGTLPAYSAAKAGTYTLSLPLTLSGDTDGNYKLKTAAVTVPAEITKAELAIEQEDFILTKTYDGTVNAGEMSGRLYFTGRYEGDDVMVFFVELPDYGDVNVGAYKLTMSFVLEGSDAGNYKLKTASVDVPAEITKAAIAPMVEGVVDTDYTGSKIAPVVTVKNGTVVLALNTDYTVEYGENTDAGTGTVTVKAVENGNYSFADAVEEFAIRKVDYSGSAVTASKSVSERIAAEGVELDLSALAFPAGFKELSFDSVTVSENTDGLISGTPVLNGSKVMFNAEAVEIGKTAVLNITVSSKNYKDYIVTLTVTAAEKNDLEKLEEAKPLAEEAVQHITADKTATAEEILKAVADSVSSVSGADAAWKADNPTVTAAGHTTDGSIIGTIVLTSGSAVEEIAVSMTIPATGHTWSTVWSRNADKHWHDCTGGDGGKKDEADHTWDSGKATTPATDTEEGVKTYTCTVCEQTKTEAIPAAGREKAEEAGELAAEVVLDITVTNETTADGILKAAADSIASVSGAKVSWKPGTLKVTPATKDSAGSVTGTILVTCGNETVEIPVDKIIGKLPAVAPEITAGGGQTHQISDGAELTVTCSGALEELKGVYVDGNLVEASNYTLQAGSTVLTLKAAYLNSLSVGTHTLRLLYMGDVYAETTFKVSEKSEGSTDTPPTGDSSNFALLFALLLAGGAGLLSLRRKKR